MFIFLLKNSLLLKIRAQIVQIIGETKIFLGLMPKSWCSYYFFAAKITNRQGIS